MNKNNRNVPDGTRDIIFEEERLKKEIGRRLADVYESAGFDCVSTPAIEYFDVFDYPGQSIGQEEMFKLTDPSGRLIVLRADNTTPVARIAATKLKNSVLPLKIYYTQDVWRIMRGYSGRRSEFTQSGAELIGAPGLKGDLICLSCAIDALAALGVEYKLELGCVGYYSAIVDSLELSDEDKADVLRWIDAKNSVSLSSMSQRVDDAEGFDRVRSLPLLYGGADVFSEAEKLADGNAKALDALSYLKRLYDALCEAGYSDRVIIDLGMVHSIDYYTGVVFTGYISGAGEPVLTGGRYDNLISNFGGAAVPATGFAINLSLVCDALKSRSGSTAKKSADILIHFDPEDFSAARKFALSESRSGKHAELSPMETPEETSAYARRAGIPEAAVIKGDTVEIISVSGGRS